MAGRILLAITLVLGVASCARLGFERGGGRGGPVVTTAAPPPPEIGPVPAEIPDVPADRIVALRPGGVPTAQQQAFMERQPGYVQGSGRLEAIYQGVDGPLAILTWETEGEVLPRIGNTGPQICESIAPVGDEPDGWGCGSAPAENPKERYVGGMEYTYEIGGQNLIKVHHGVGIEATVVELIDGKSFVIRPGDSSISYHEWVGAPSARVTVFWEDGSSASELTSAP